MELNPEELDAQTRYKLLIGGVTPRPIALVSSLSAEGVANLAPFSFFNAAGPTPMTLMFAPVVKRDGQEKDTLRNVRPIEEGGTGAFVVNLAVEAYARRMAATSHPMPADESEFERAGLYPAPSVRVRAPRVSASPIAFECVTSQIVPVDPTTPPGQAPLAGSSYVVFGRVVHVYVADDCIDERYRIDPEAVATIGRMGGKGYTRTRERFDLQNDLGALQQNPPFPEDTGKR